MNILCIKSLANGRNSNWNLGGFDKTSMIRFFTPINGRITFTLPPFLPYFTVPPSITSMPASLLKLDEGEQLTLACRAIGNPLPKIVWYITKTHETFDAVSTEHLIPAVNAFLKYDPRAFVRSFCIHSMKAYSVFTIKYSSTRWQFR